MDYIIFLIFYCYFVFFEPNVLGHPDNYIPANPLVTPTHIVPEWYFLPFYAILRAIPDKLGGVIGMFGAILILLIIPLIDTSKIRTSAFRPIYKKSYWIFVGNVILLGWLGNKPVEEPYVILGQIATITYFSYFLILIPIIGIIENSLMRYKLELNSLEQK